MYTPHYTCIHISCTSAYRYTHMLTHALCAHTQAHIHTDIRTVHLKHGISTHVQTRGTQMHIPLHNVHCKYIHTLRHHTCHTRMYPHVCMHSMNTHASTYPHICIPTRVCARTQVHIATPCCGLVCSSTQTSRAWAYPGTKPRRTLE